MTERVEPSLDLSVFALVHLGCGDCALAGGCELCTTDTDDFDSARTFHVDAARRLWELHRESIIATWAKRLSDRGEPGTSTLPMFAEVLFDGVRLPACNPRWPSTLKSRHKAIERALWEVREFKRAHI